MPVRDRTACPAHDNIIHSVLTDLHSLFHQLAAMYKITERNLPLRTGHGAGLDGAGCQFAIEDEVPHKLLESTCEIWSTFGILIPLYFLANHAVQKQIEQTFVQPRCHGPEALDVPRYILQDQNPHVSRKQRSIRLDSIERQWQTIASKVNECFPV